MSESTLLDKVEIQETISRYHEGASLFDFDQIAACFTADGVWEVPSMKIRLEGRDTIRQQMPELVAPIAYLVQINAPAIIDVAADSATARTLIREVAKFREGGVLMDVVGQFNDRLERTAEGWRFAHRSITIIGTHTTTEPTNA